MCVIYMKHFCFLSFNKKWRVRIIHEEIHIMFLHKRLLHKRYFTSICVQDLIKTWTNWAVAHWGPWFCGSTNFISIFCQVDTLNLFWPYVCYNLCFVLLKLDSILSKTCIYLKMHLYMYSKTLKIYKFLWQYRKGDGCEQMPGPYYLFSLTWFGSWVYYYFFILTATYHYRIKLTVHR